MIFTSKKKLLSLILIAITISLAACNKEGEAASPAKAQDASQTAPTPLNSLTITQWGPQDTKAAVDFNTQPDGSSALWIQVNQSLEGSDSVVNMDDKPLTSAISGNLITATVPSNFYAAAGTHLLHIRVKKGTTETQSGDVKFVVR